MAQDSSPETRNDDYSARATTDSHALQRAYSTLTGVQVIRERAVHAEDISELSERQQRDIAIQNDDRVIEATTRLGVARLVAHQALSELIEAQDGYQDAVGMADEQLAAETGIPYQLTAQ